MGIVVNEYGGEQFDDPKISDDFKFDQYKYQENNLKVHPSRK